jgi:hypothetical protein
MGENSSNLVTLFAGARSVRKESVANPTGLTGFATS